MLNFESLLILSRGQLSQKRLLFDNRQVTKMLKVIQRSFNYDQECEISIIFQLIITIYRFNQE